MPTVIACTLYQTRSKRFTVGLVVAVVVFAGCNSKHCRTQYHHLITKIIALNSMFQPANKKGKSFFSVVIVVRCRPTNGLKSPGFNLRVILCVRRFFFYWNDGIWWGRNMKRVRGRKRKRVLIIKMQPFSLSDFGWVANSLNVFRHERIIGSNFNAIYCVNKRIACGRFT